MEGVLLGTTLKKDTLFSSQHELSVVPQGRLAPFPSYDEMLTGPVWCKWPQLQWVHGCGGGVMPRRHSSAALLPDLWLLRSTYPLFQDGHWALQRSGDTHVLFRILGSIITATGSWSSLHFKKAKRKERKQLSPLEWALNPTRKQLVTPIPFMILLPNGNTSCQGGHCCSQHGLWLGRTFL